MATLLAGTNRTGGWADPSLEERRNSLLLLKHDTLTVQPAALFNITLKQVLRDNIVISLRFIHRDQNGQHKCTTLPEQSFGPLSHISGHLRLYRVIRPARTESTTRNTHNFRAAVSRLLVLVSCKCCLHCSSVTREDRMASRLDYQCEFHRNAFTSKNEKSQKTSMLDDVRFYKS
jgi:hypothetical protein